MENKSPNTVPAAIISIAFVLSAIIAGYTFYSIRSLDNSLSVTGSAKEGVKADTAKWSITVNKIAYEGGVSNAYTEVSSNLAKVKAFLLKNGVKAEEVSISPIFSDDYWGKENVRQINVRQVITVSTSEVNRIKTISENTTVLAEQGVIFSPSSPEYYISNLPQLRVSLIGKAVTDAQARAASIAKSTGQHVGSLKSASSGVVQVMQSNSNDVSDYGQYDTSTIEKDVMVSVRATFGVN